ncbi:MAG: prepilin-type N-terminal cleavage/methylation domain-containing protein [Planctomycetota bacterium]
MSHHQLSIRHYRGFTLIELLVVISIIALLIGILLPALGAARYAARLVACATQQQQLGRGLATYQADMDGHYPLLAAQIPNYGAVEFTWDDRLALGGYDGRSLASLGTALGNVGSVPLKELAEGAAAVYACPLAAGVNLPARTSYDGTGTERGPRDYAISRWIRNGGGSSNMNNGIAGHDASVGNPFNVDAAISRRSEDLTKSSNTIVLGDNLAVFPGANAYTRTPLGGWEGSGIWGNTHEPNNANVARAIGHHSRSSEDPSGSVQTEFEPNYLFGDGHVATQSNALAFESRLDPNTGLPSNNIFFTNGTQWDAEQ